MADRLDAFARRLGGDPEFLASALQSFARSEGLDGPALAAFLGCDTGQLGRLGLCRRPAGGSLQSDMSAIAGRFGVHKESLAEVVRRADVLDALRAASEDAEIVAAARDRQEEDEP